MGTLPDVIRVAMRDEHSIQIRHRDTRFRQTLTAALARINQHPRLAGRQEA
jgi:hypothetical protein